MRSYRGFIASMIVFAVCLFALLSGCSALDQLVPAGAGHPAIPAGPNNPTTQPAVAANVPYQLSIVLHDAASTQTAQAAASAVPYGNLVLIGLTTLSGLAAAYFGKGNAQKGALLNSLQSATDTTDNHSATAAAIAGIEGGPGAVAAYKAPAVAP